MWLRTGLTAFALLWLIVACSKNLPVYRVDALTRFYAVKNLGAERRLPCEFASIQDALATGDKFLQTEDVEMADRFYLLALQKTSVLEQAVEQQLQRERQAKAEQEARQLEIERREALVELKRKLEEERLKVECEERKRLERAASARDREREERPLAQYHTVKRGETLPQIAAQADVYNDASLWPILYRANRDQIRDPRRIWPGQVLRIPRNMSREDIVEAHRYAQERQIP